MANGSLPGGLGSVLLLEYGISSNQRICGSLRAVQSLQVMLNSWIEETVKRQM